VVRVADPLDDATEIEKVTAIEFAGEASATMLVTFTAVTATSSANRMLYIASAKPVASAELCKAFEASRREWGALVGEAVGFALGDFVGEAVGFMVVVNVSVDTTTTVVVVTGVNDGLMVGGTEGVFEGAVDGDLVGAMEGAEVGAMVGFDVG